MERFLLKQDQLIQKYEELSKKEDLNHEEMIKCRQEINRHYHICEHFLRCQFNWAGRYFGLGVGAIFGFLLILNGSRLRTGIFNSEFMFKSAMGMIGLPGFGYYYATKYHSKYPDCHSNMKKYNDHKSLNCSKISQIDEIVTKKISASNH